jgi:hypothetical protein
MVMIVLTVHVFHQCPDFFTVVDATIVHDNDAAWAGICSGVRHLVEKMSVTK